MNDDPANDRQRKGLDDPRALQILTTEHWSLLSTRALGYQEMFGRTTIFVGVLSGTAIALALLAQATRFGRDALLFALLLISVDLFIGLATFCRSVIVNYEDAVCVSGMNLLRQAYVQIIPEVEPYFVMEQKLDLRSLSHGSTQHLINLERSLTTTSGVVATLNSVLAGSIVGGVAALLGQDLTFAAAIGAAMSIVSSMLHVRYAARFRERHPPSANGLRGPA
jgi:hypothetical protein